MARSHAVDRPSSRGFLISTDLKIRTDGVRTAQLGKLTLLECFFDWGSAVAGKVVVSDPAHLDSFDADFWWD